MTVLVTGAAGGIGRAAVNAFRSGPLPETVLGQDLLPAQEGGFELAGDLGDPRVLDALAEAVGDGALRVVVAAHGVAGAGALAELSDLECRRIMTVNFESVVLLWQRLRPALESCNGRFVVVASQAGLRAEANNGVYSASKAALVGWLQGLEARTAARLRLVHPGATRTPLLESALRGMATARGVTYNDVLAERNRGAPVGRLGTPEEIGAAIRWLADLETPNLVELAITGGEVLH